MISLRPVLLSLVLAAAACAPPEGPAVPVVNVTAAAPVAPAPPAAAPAGVDLPTPSTPPPERDGRFRDRPSKSRAILITEIQGLESLFSSTSAASPDRPALMNRLALTYGELERRAESDRTTQPAGPAQVELVEKAKKILRAARMQAVKYYTALVRTYPEWCAAPNAADPSLSTGCRETSLYYLALTYERAGQLDDARKAYLDLIQGAPASYFVPLAYLAFGEMFVDEARHNPSRLGLAFQAFQEVAKYPPPGNPAHAWATERMVQVREAAQRLSVPLE